jgi:hypothetical protein
MQVEGCQSLLETTPHKLYFLTLKWAVTEKFLRYLMGPTLSVYAYTCNNPLPYILTSAKLDATRLSWVEALSAYQFTITYSPCKTMRCQDCKVL